MDSIVTQPKHETDAVFDTARITAAIDALAEKHAGREDAFRSAVAQLLKAELIDARDAAQKVLLRDRHGRRCARPIASICIVPHGNVRPTIAVRIRQCATE